MLIHETLSATPNELIVGAGIALLCGPAFLRTDEWRKR